MKIMHYLFLIIPILSAHDSRAMDSPPLPAPDTPATTANAFELLSAATSGALASAFQPAAGTLQRSASHTDLTATLDPTRALRRSASHGNLQDTVSVGAVSAPTATSPTPPKAQDEVLERLYWKHLFDSDHPVWRGLRKLWNGITTKVAALIAHPGDQRTEEELKKEAERYVCVTAGALAMAVTGPALGAYAFRTYVAHQQAQTRFLFAIPGIIEVLKSAYGALGGLGTAGVLFFLYRKITGFFRNSYERDLNDVRERQRNLEQQFKESEAQTAREFAELAQGYQDLQGELDAISTSQDAIETKHDAMMTSVQRVLEAAQQVLKEREQAQEETIVQPLEEQPQQSTKQKTWSWFGSKKTKKQEK